MNRLLREKRAHILALLCNGNSMRATSRIADVSINTVTKLLVDSGQACSAYQDRAFQNLPCQRVQVDEIWAFVGMMAAKVPEDKKGLDVGDIWTWVALCADTKLVPSWWVGGRDAENARALLSDLSARMAGRIQLTSDGHTAYPDAVKDAFLDQVDYAQLVKIYGEAPEAERRYSRSVCVGTRKEACIGQPERKHISTSYVRQNLTMRMNIRRFTRLTNAFSKKAENHCHAVALHFMYYNFVRIHKTLKVTPAMAAGVTDKLWDVSDIVDVIEVWEREPVAIEAAGNADLERLVDGRDGWVPKRLRYMGTSYGARRN